MSSHDDLASLPPATLRAALDASEKRIKREKEQIHREIRRLQRRLEQLEEGEDVPEMELEKNIAGGSRRKGKRPRVDSSSDDGASVYMKPYNPRSTAKARRVDPEPVSPQSPSCTKCKKKGVRCEWDENSTSRRCLACQRSRLGCDLKRPTPAGPGTTLA